MKNIEYGTEFLDQLKDSVHDLYDRNKELLSNNVKLREEKLRLNNIIDKAIEYIEYYFAKGRTKNHKQFDLSLYEILTGKNLFNLTMEEIEQFFKGVDKE